MLVCNLLNEYKTVVEVVLVHSIKKLIKNLIHRGLKVLLIGLLFWLESTSEISAQILTMTAFYK